jgi:hypothetical protein
VHVAAVAASEHARTRPNRQAGETVGCESTEE